MTTSYRIESSCLSPRAPGAGLGVSLFDGVKPSCENDGALPSPWRPASTARMVALRERADRVRGSRA